jgi:hypothetical protein
MMVHPTDAALTDTAVVCPRWSVCFAPCTYCPVLPLERARRTCINKQIFKNDIHNIFKITSDYIQVTNTVCIQTENPTKLFSWYDCAQKMRVPSHLSLMHPLGTDGDDLLVWRVAETILNKHLQTANKEWSYLRVQWGAHNISQKKINLAC